LVCWSWASTNTRRKAEMNAAPRWTPQIVHPTRPHLYNVSTLRSRLPPSRHHALAFALSIAGAGQERPRRPRLQDGTLPVPIPIFISVLLVALRSNDITHAFLKIGAGAAERHRLAQPAGRSWEAKAQEEAPCPVPQLLLHGIPVHALF